MKFVEDLLLDIIGKCFSTSVKCDVDDNISIKTKLRRVNELVDDFSKVDESIKKKVL